MGMHAYVRAFMHVVVEVVNGRIWLRKAFRYSGLTKRMRLLKFEFFFNRFNPTRTFGLIGSIDSSKLLAHD